MLQPWEDAMEPFRLVGNVYYVGTYSASAHMIATGEGLILLDTGYPQNLYLLIDNIYTLGFNPHDLRYLLHTHGHYDHLGATRALAQLTGAKTCIGALDAPYADGTLDLTWARELGTVYTGAFTPDILLNDGDCIQLGDTEIECLATPGHTPGCMSFFFETREDERVYRCGMFGGSGMNSMERCFLKRYGLTDETRRQFPHSLHRAAARAVDVTLGNHTWLNGTKEKYARMRQEKENPFVDPSEWSVFLKDLKTQYTKMLEREA